MSQGRKNTYSCSSCLKKFDKPALLKRHEAVHLPTKQYQCQVCHRDFSQNSSLQRHIREKHKGRKAYKCPQCRKRFTQLTNLKLHAIRVHDTQSAKIKFACSECDCFLKTENSLKRHKTLYHKRKEDHLALLNSDEPLSLAQKVLEQFKSLQNDPELVPKAKSTKLSLKNENNNTNLSLPYLKNEEDKEISMIEENPSSQIVALIDRLYPENEERSLVVQSITRSNGKSYFVCEFCAMEFRKTYDFIRHRRKHTNERPFICPKCTKAFITKSKLNDHLKIHLMKESNGITINLRKKSDDEEMKMLIKLLPEPISINSDEIVCENETELEKFHDIIERWNQEDIDEQNVCLRDEFPTRFYLNEVLPDCEINVQVEFQNYCCKSCPKKKFSTKNQLEDHLKSVHKKNRNIFKCPYCEDFFKSKIICKNHMKDHLRELLETTQTAQNSSVCKENEEASDKTQEDGDDIPLEKKTTEASLTPFFIEIQMIPQLELSKPPNIIIKTLEQPKNLDSDKREKAEESNSPLEPKQPKNKSNHACSFCLKIFQKSSDLQRHLRRHTKEKPFTCEQCHKSFALKSTLSYHLLTHSDERKSYPCQVCGKKYASRKSQHLHLRLHTDEKPFCCESCGKFFRTSGHLLAHLKGNKFLCKKVENHLTFLAE